MPNILEAKNITKVFKEGSNLLKILEDSSFSIEKGKSIALVGQSGCGKSTLLQICGLLDSFDSGDIIINDKSTKNLNDDEKTRIRKENIGFVYQMHHLFPEFTAVENVMLPLIIRKEKKKEIRSKAEEMLASLGLGDRLYYSPSKLSGGEKQRVAIARALITNPNLVLADEPTGNLDDKNSQKIMDVLLKKLDELGSSLLMVTHNIEIAKNLDKIMTLENHKVIDY